MIELELNEVSYESDGIELFGAFFVEYEVTGVYEAASFDSEGCEHEIEFTIYDNDGEEVEKFIEDQIEELVSEKCWEDYKKVCEDNNASRAAELASDREYWG